MTKRLWSLGWSRYPKRGEIKVNPNLITFLVRYEDEEECENNFNILQGWMADHGLMFLPVYPEGVMEVVTGCQMRFGMGSSGDIQIECSQGEFIGEIRELFSTSNLGLNALFFGEVSHGAKVFSLSRVEGVGTMYTGTVAKEDENDLYPYKFIEFRLNNLLLAKALVSHFNSEMYECAPTIELVEVRKTHQGKGIGRKLVRFIERSARSEGFDRIWATDADTSFSFWERLGYEWDLDEAYRYLHG